MRKSAQTISVIVCFLLMLPFAAAAQSGGQFSITQSVLANGGTESNGGNLSLTGTTAQPVAGANSTGEQFVVNGGFWQSFFAPTAATASVSGRVTTANGYGINGARVMIMNQLGQSQTMLTSTFGHFKFSSVLTGEIYLVTVYNRRYRFTNGTQILIVDGDLNDLIFIAEWQD